ncbi:MAG TPA: hypothetical protein VGJ05_12065 [Fimbriiglobus sp.]|jgi:WD40 repeat protein
MRVFEMKECNCVNVLSFSSDGRYILAAGGWEAKGSEHAFVLDSLTGESAFEYTFAAEHITASQECSLFAISNGSPVQEDMTVRVASQGRWEEVPFRVSQSTGWLAISCLEFLPEGKRIAIGCRGASGLTPITWPDRDTEMIDRILDWVAIWQLNPAKMISEHVTAHPVGVVSFRPDGRQFAFSGGATSFATVHLCDERDGLLNQTFNPLGIRTRCLSYSPDGKKLAVGNARVVYMLDATTLSIVWELRGHKGHVNKVVFTNDGRKLISVGHDMTARMWEVETGRLTTTFDWKIGRLTTVAVSPDGTMAAAGGENGRIVLWDLDP